jgi:eukaryotic-like serine/threonine-protein kinase
VRLCSSRLPGTRKVPVSSLSRMGTDSESGGAPASSPYKPRSVLAGRYQVRREIGRGGMGIVLLCRDLVVDERVALKLLIRPGVKMRPEDTWWFQEEARALAGLAHPAIVRARDFGSLEDGTPYLAMDAVPGRSLHEWIYLAHTDGLLPWPIVWTCIDQVLGALAHAHARGVIHGDLKPSNVLLDIPPDGADCTVHVLDLGLAWLMQDRVDHRLDGGRALEPTVRWGAGTPGWMAPEQIRFAAPHIGPPTDLYALGCILFALLSDREPFIGTNEELLSQHKSGPVPEPDTPPGVPPEVAAFVMKLMAKRPWHRFEFAADARRVWRRWDPALAGGPATTTPLPLGKVAREALASGQAGHASGSSGSTPEILLVAEPQPTTTGLLNLRPSPFVARGFERARLLEVVADVAERGGHRLVLLCGEAGVGKSRLAEWLCEEVHERAIMVPLRARYRKIAAPLDGVVGAVTQHYRLERAERDIVEKVLMNLWDVPLDDEEEKTWVAATSEWIRPAVTLTDGAPAPSGPSGKRFALDRPELRWLIIRRVLARIAEKRPILLWMDDLHLASPTTFEGLLGLHRDAPQLGLMVVATLRSDAVEADPAAAAMVEATLAAFGGERLDVAPLSPAQTHALVRETLPLEDAAIVEAAARSKGNPLFALQLVHAWAQGGHMELREGRYVVARESLEVRAATTADLWEERLRALPPALRRGAMAAAALGGDIRRDVLRAELEAIGVDPDAAIQAMMRAQILLSSGDRLRWPHALLQEHLLAQIFLQPDANAVFRAAAAALARHPSSSSRRIIRHRVVNLLRAGDFERAATLLHEHTAHLWGRSRDASATLRDLALLDGKLTGAAAATHLRWRAEALRHEGKIEHARREAEEARRLFEALEDRTSEAHCLRLLGHIASDLGAPAHGRRMVARALSLFAELGVEHGQAQCELVIGEIDYLLGDHIGARHVLSTASERFLKSGDWLGRALCLVLQGWVEQAGGAPAFARELMRTARADFDAIGYRLGMAQCDATLAHADHREGELVTARSGALGARQAFRDLANPRGEGGCERLLGMIALDAGSPSAAQEHARAAAKIYACLADPWGEVEARLLHAQIALDCGDPDAARDHLIACEAFALAEAEPKQHRHLTLAWLAYHEGRFQDAAREIDLARAAFKDPTRTADHTPQLLDRFARMGWPKPASTRIASWRRAIGRITDTDAQERPSGRVSRRSPESGQGSRARGSGAGGVPTSSSRRSGTIVTTEPSEAPQGDLFEDRG